MCSKRASEKNFYLGISESLPSSSSSMYSAFLKDCLFFCFLLLDPETYEIHVWKTTWACNFDLLNGLQLDIALNLLQYETNANYYLNIHARYNVRLYLRWFSLSFPWFRRRAFPIYQEKPRHFVFYCREKTGYESLWHIPKTLRLVNRTNARAQTSRKRVRANHIP